MLGEVTLASRRMPTGAPRCMSWRRSASDFAFWRPYSLTGMETPKGHFYIRERLTGFGSTYGPVAFGTSAYSRLSDWPGGGVIGIHGTDQPGLIPGRPSHGCIRVPNAKIVRLRRLMPVGTPVSIVGG